MPTRWPVWTGLGMIQVHWSVGSLYKLYSLSIAHLKVVQCLSTNWDDALQILKICDLSFGMASEPRDLESSIIHVFLVFIGGLGDIVIQLVKYHFLLTQVTQIHIVVSSKLAHLVPVSSDIFQNTSSGPLGSLSSRGHTDRRWDFWLLCITVSLSVLR